MKLFKNLLSSLLALSLGFSLSISAFASNEDTPPEVFSDSYVVMDLDTSQVLIEKNMDKQEYPASITKIMTLALALENGELTDEITVCKDCIAGFTSEDAHIALKEGEEISLRDAVYATHLMSANDAANVVAHHIGGSIPDFVDMMNQKAKEIGCKNTHFENPNGMPKENHLTTAYDMALITKYALSVPGFEDVFNSTQYVMKKTNKTPEERNFGTFHYMVTTSAFSYNGALGGKLGWTKPAGHTIVTTASRSGINLVCVAMKSTNKFEKYKDTTALFDYCFDNFHEETLSGATLKANPVPVLKGEKTIFEIEPIFKDKYKILLHNSHSSKDIDYSSNLKESYSYDEDINPQLIFTVKNCQAEMKDSFSIPLEYKGGKTANASITTTFDRFLDGFLDGFLSFVILIVKTIAICLGIALIIRFYNKNMFKRKNKSQKTKKKL